MTGAALILPFEGRSPELDPTAWAAPNATPIGRVRLEAGSLVAAGAVVLEGSVVPPGSLVAGVPARARRPLSTEEIERIRRDAATCRALTAAHRLL